jgi:hypothetical protein
MESCIEEPTEPPRENVVAVTIGIVHGEVVSLTIQSLYDTTEVEERIHIFRRTPGDDRQDMQIWPVIDKCLAEDARHRNRCLGAQSPRQAE